MKNVIYSIYIKGTNYERKYRQNNLNYFDFNYEKLVECKKRYADICNSDFVIFNNDSNYEQFENEIKEKFNYLDSYSIINLYKYKTFEILSNDYNNILFLDFDVIPNTNINFFEVNDMANLTIRKKVAHINDPIANRQYVEMQRHLDLIGDDNLIYNFNTGVFACNSNTYKNLKLLDKMKLYIDDIHSFILSNKELYLSKENEFEYHPDNEYLLSKVIKDYNIDINLLEGTWNFEAGKKIEKKHLENNFFIHCIYKKFITQILYSVYSHNKLI